MPEQPSVSILSFGPIAHFVNKDGSEQGKPLLLVDVDGVLSLWGFPPDARPDGSFRAIDGTPHFLSAEAGRHLHALAEAFDLVWCTGWEEKANWYLPHALGLPEPLPYLSFDRHVAPGGTTPGHWKLAAIDAHAGDRPAAWIDDAHNEACEAWVDGRDAPTLLVPTDPAEGLVERHARQLRAWAAAVTRSRPMRFEV